MDQGLEPHQAAVLRDEPVLELLLRAFLERPGRQRQDALPVFRGNQQGPEVRVARGRIQAVTEHLLRAAAHEVHPKRRGIRFPHDAPGDALDQIAVPVPRGLGHAPLVSLGLVEKGEPACQQDREDERQADGEEAADENQDGGERRLPGGCEIRRLENLPLVEDVGGEAALEGFARGLDFFGEHAGGLAAELESDGLFRGSLVRLLGALDPGQEVPLLLRE